MAYSPGGGSKEETRLLWRLAGMGFQFGTEIIAGVLLGWLADRMMGTAPWGVLIGSLMGIAVATLDLLRKAMRLNREMDRAESIRNRGAATNRGDDRAKPQAADAPEEELTHEQWKSLRDRDLEQDNDDEREG